MSWHTPHTWYMGETITSGTLNTYLRDELNVLKTNIDSIGAIKTQLGCFGYSVGYGNPATDVATESTAHRVMIPAGFLAQPGDELEILLTTFSSATAGTKYVQFSIGAGALVTAATLTTVSVSYVSRWVVRYRTTLTCNFSGVTIVGAHLGYTTNMIANAILVPGASLATTSQNLSIWLRGASLNEITIADYCVNCLRSTTGATV